VGPEFVFQVASRRRDRSVPLKTLNPFAKDAHVISLKSPAAVYKRVGDARHPVPQAEGALRNPSVGSIRFIRHANGIHGQME